MDVDSILMLELSGGSQGWRLPSSWVRLQLDDYESHASYPALVQEMRAGWVNIYGKLPGDSTDCQQGNLSTIINELIDSGNNNEEVFYMFGIQYFTSLIS